MCAHGVMVIIVENEHGDTSSNPGWDYQSHPGFELVSPYSFSTTINITPRAHISHSANTLGKGINPIIFPPAFGKNSWAD